ncbi:MAG: GHKL domain-containing protein [Desulfamplus sp.]|nr:GHKL domain-containing protein [Desulfamplus sp.]
MENLKKKIPLWIPNAIVFLLLFLFVTGYFYWQIRVVKISFFSHVRQHTDMVSKIISLNAAGTLNARKSIEDVLVNLLGNSARFVAYLDMIEPFESDELAAFARENGLQGISIIPDVQGRYQGAANVHAPENWLHLTESPHESFLSGKEIEMIEDGLLNPSNLPSLAHFATKNLYLFTWSDGNYPGHILLGIRDNTLEDAIKSFGLEKTVSAISTVPGIRYVKIIPGDMADVDVTPFEIIREDDHDIVQSSQMVQGMELKVGVDGGRLTLLIHNLTVSFHIFSLFLIITGLLLSLLLHSYQKSAINRVKYFERELSNRREEANLGRSAAAIAHEIRNPLNSISMGLQRLCLENACSSEIHLKLIRQMSEAVNRANSSVTGLLTYARPKEPNFSTFSPADLLSNIFMLYHSDFLKYSIDNSLDIIYSGNIESDVELMARIVENIVKNAIEAQHGGGYIHCSLAKVNDQDIAMIFKNGNCTVAPEDSEKIFEPYFTTRTDGTGLGMAIVRSVVKSLGGDIAVEVKNSGDILIQVHIPVGSPGMVENKRDFHGKMKAMEVPSQ